MGPNRPIHEIRLGCIRAAIWQNEKKGGEAWFNVTPSRLYKDDDGSWKDTVSFRRDDLPIVAKALDMAYQWIWTQEKVTVEEKE